jgi:hypothetical protein
MTVINIKRGDTKGVFVDTLTLNGTPVNLTGCTLLFLMRRKGKPLKSVQQTGLIVDPLGAAVQYQPILADVNQSGVYEQEWEVTFPSGQVLTFPNYAWNIVNILRDLGGVSGGPP